MTEMLDIDSAWSSFCDGDYNINSVNTIPQNSVDKAPKCMVIAPSPSRHNTLVFFLNATPVAIDIA